MTLKKINTILELKQQAEIEIKNELKLAFSKELLDLLFSHPYIKIGILEQFGIAKRQTASEYLKKIELLGWLHSMKIGRETYYINHRLIDVLSQ